MEHTSILVILYSNELFTPRKHPRSCGLTYICVGFFLYIFYLFTATHASIWYKYPIHSDANCIEVFCGNMTVAFGFHVDRKPSNWTWKWELLSWVLFLSRKRIWIGCTRPWLCLYACIAYTHRLVRAKTRVHTDRDATFCIANKTMNVLNFVKKIANWFSAQTAKQTFTFILFSLWKSLLRNYAIVSAGMVTCWTIMCICGECRMDVAFLCLNIFNASSY